MPGGHWDGALRGPEHLAAALLGEPADPPADDVPYVFSTQLGHELALLGLPEGGDVVLRGDPRTGPWAALWFRGDVLAAILTVDRPRDVGAARRLLAGAAPPVLDRAVAADAGRPLRDAAR
ncbi:oxidoreductase C-terminal domain-containing protein [Cellulomonas massiliensis]|uniref:oxidoreductase C-terminal domain-containing protein n=1 Tax=Cellulomonas massiliensis TaxID=1465811 RepID=UPI001FEC1E34|nr:oxidoreductase C-terminal domain-containing protein [Cellulomonas massiliensis]